MHQFKLTASTTAAGVSISSVATGAGSSSSLAFRPRPRGVETLAFLGGGVGGVTGVLPRALDRVLRPPSVEPPN